MVQTREKVEVALLATASPSYSYSIIATLAMCQAKIVVAIVGHTWLPCLFLPTGDSKT